MCLRSFDHLLQHSDLVMKRAIPLGFGLGNVSNPQVPVQERLSKLSHDVDQQVSISAIFSLGLIGASTNNARLGTILRQLAGYYNKDQN